MPFSPRLSPSGLSFLFNSERIPKHVQNLYKSYTSPAANKLISPPIFRSESARKRAPPTPPFPPIFGKKCCISIGEFFCNIFRPHLPLFLSGQEPQKLKCNTFAENATPSRPFSGAPPHRRKAPPSATEMMNWRTPENLYRVREVRASLLGPAIQMARRSASQNRDEPSYASTNDKIAASPQFELRQGELAALTPHTSLLTPRFCSHSESGMRPGSTAVPPPQQS